MSEKEHFFCQKSRKNLHMSEISCNFAPENVTTKSGAPTRNVGPYGESGAPEYLNEPVALVEGSVDVRG